MANCWPFTYLQTLKASDNRTLIDVKGHATLFLKVVHAGVRSVFAAAFRNGSQTVATAISSLHYGHEWEGVVLDNQELRAYKGNQSSLKKMFFRSVDLGNNDGNEERSNHVNLLLEDLLHEKIEACTLRQGEPCCLSNLNEQQVSFSHFSYFSYSWK